MMSDMAGITLLLGILLLIRIISTPLDKPLFGRFLKISTAILGALYVAYVVWLGMRVPGAAAYLIGQTFGSVVILLIFVAIGTAVRKRKSRKADITPTTPLPK
jgi:hypothetical protein